MKKFLPHFLLTALVFLIYGSTLQHSFHFDDIPSILEKPWIRGMDKISQFIFSAAQRPLVILSFNFNFALSRFHVWSYHVFNILFHVAVTLLVYRLGRTISEVFLQFHPEEALRYHRAPLWAAILFAVHPLNTQAVTYISSRSSMMAALFYLAALILFYKGLFLQIAEHEQSRSSLGSLPKKSTWKWFGGGVVTWVLGVFCKGTVVTLPGPAFLFHYFFISNLSFPGWLRKQIKWVSLSLGVLLGAIALKVLLTGPLLATSPTEFSSTQYFLTQTFVVPFDYFRKLLWPVNLNIDIGFPLILDWAKPIHFIGLVVLGLIFALLINSRDRWMRFGLAWCFITLIPTSSVMPLLDVAVEHRMYLPLVGICIAAGAGICRLEDALRKGLLFPLISRAVLLRFAWAGCFLLVIGFASITLDRNQVWKNEVTLWTDAKKKSPHLVRPYNNLGEAYDKLKRYGEAIVEFEAALKLNPNYVFGLSNIGNIYGKMGRYEKSKEYFRRAIQIKPDYAPAHYNLARALSLTGKKEESRDHYAEAVKYNTFFEEAWFNLAFTESEIGEFEQSVKHYKKYLEFRPRYAKAWFGIAMGFFRLKKYSEAATAFSKAIEIDPKYLSPRINLAVLYMEQNKFEQALNVYLNLIGDFGNIAEVHKNLGILYSQHKQDPVKAAYHFRESLRLKPRQPQADQIRNLVMNLEFKIIRKDSP